MGAEVASVNVMAAPRSSSSPRGPLRKCRAAASSPLQPRKNSPALGAEDALPAAATAVSAVAISVAFACQKSLKPGKQKGSGGFGTWQPAQMTRCRRPVDWQYASDFSSSRHGSQLPSSMHVS